MTYQSIGRRGFLGGTMALGSLAVSGAASAAPAGRPRPPRHTDRRGIVIHNAYVMTMDPELGDIPDGDVYVKDGKIVEVARRIDARRTRGAVRVDGRGMIVLPGLVETHWHLWTGLFRSLSGDVPDRAYFPMSQALGRLYRAKDMYLGGLLSAAEAIYAGITYVHDWCHQVQEPSYAEACLRALADADIRGRYGYGKPNWSALDTSIDLAHLERLHDEWDDYSNGGLLSLGVAWNGRMTFGVARPADVVQREFDTAKRLGIPMSAHLFAGGIADLAAHDLLPDGLQVVHAVGASQAERETLAAAGGSLSVSPYTELRIGFGFPDTSEFVAAGVPVSLSIDTTALSGNADMFAIMKVIQNIENAKQQNEFAMPARRVLEMGTIEGARSMGMDDQIGSLKPGKQADLIMVRTGDVNMGPFSNPDHLVVEATQPSNVDTVIIGGKIVKWDGRLVELDVEEIVSQAEEAAARIRHDGGL